MKTKFSKWLKQLWSNYNVAPLEFQAFFAFCILITVYGVLIHPFLPQGIRESTIPITGWNIFVPYGFNLTILYSFLINPGKYRGHLGIQYGNILLLAITIAFGIFDLITWKGGFEGNPYLHRSPWRLVWKIAIPLIWIVVLLSPRVKKYLYLMHSKESIE